MDSGLRRLGFPVVVAVSFLLATEFRCDAQNRPPLEGPLTWIALTLTDDDEIVTGDWEASSRPDYTGSALTAATRDHVLAVLDSGASAHLISYPDSSALGLDAGWRTGNTVGVGGAGGTIDVDVTYPLGVFVHGAQERSMGMAQTALMVGEGNCSVAVNTEANYMDGSTIPTVIGMPLFPYYPLEVKNSEVVEMERDGEKIRSAHVKLYDGPGDPTLPMYAHRVPLEYTVGGPLSVIWVFDLLNFDFETPGSPTIVSGSGTSAGLLRTAGQNLTLVEGALDVNLKLIFDTGAQATLISETAAIDLGLNLASPEFEVEVQGVGGIEMAPGFYLDSLFLPTGVPGGITWTEVPVVVRNISDGVGIIDGIFGANLLGNRDYLINAAAVSPYVEISDTRITPVPEITAIRRLAGGMVEVDWRCRPASPELKLEMSEDLEAGSWSFVANPEFSSLSGTIETTSSADRAFFRLVAAEE